VIETFITAFIIYFVVVDPIGNAPIFIAVTSHLGKAARTRTAIEATIVATMIMLFFATCGSWVLHYLRIGEPAFKIAGGLILFLVAWDMLNSKRQARKKKETSPIGEAGDDEPENVAIFPLAIPLLAGPAAIMSVMVVSADFDKGLAMTLTGYAALLAVMVVTGCILTAASLAENLIDQRVTNVFSRITAIILAALSVQYIVDGMTALNIVSMS
jgi:multiple antibiotic resistance protein|tara:strand:- start:26 stop:667 length:642 start_codon:yes stop_codon:yes gene_type:complete